MADADAALALRLQLAESEAEASRQASARRAMQRAPTAMEVRDRALAMELRASETAMSQQASARQCSPSAMERSDRQLAMELSRADIEAALPPVGADDSGHRLFLCPCDGAPSAEDAAADMLWHCSYDLVLCVLIIPALGGIAAVGFLAPIAGIAASRRRSVPLALAHFVLQLGNMALRGVAAPLLSTNFLYVSTAIALGIISAYLAWVAAAYAFLLRREHKGAAADADRPAHQRRLSRRCTPPQILPRLPGPRRARTGVDARVPPALGATFSSRNARSRPPADGTELTSPAIQRARSAAARALSGLGGLSHGLGGSGRRSPVQRYSPQLRSAGEGSSGGLSANGSSGRRSDHHTPPREPEPVAVVTGTPCVDVMSL